jgi:hypothetical protein
MLTRRIVGLIEGNADGLSKEIEQQLRTHPSAAAYRTIDEATLHDWIYDVCSRFSYWLSEDKDNGEVGRHYTALGKERFRQKFRLPEVISALYITKRKLWESLAASREADSALDLNQLVETSLLLVRFFDHAVLHVIKGYEEMLQEVHGYVAPLQQPERLARAIAHKREREETRVAASKLPTLCFTRGMIRRE